MASRKHFTTTLMFFTFPCMSTRTVASTPEALQETGITVAQAPESESEFAFFKHPKCLNSHPS